MALSAKRSWRPERPARAGYLITECNLASNGLRAHPAAGASNPACRSSIWRSSAENFRVRARTLPLAASAVQHNGTAGVVMNSRFGLAGLRSLDSRLDALLG